MGSVAPFGCVTVHGLSPWYTTRPSCAEATQLASVEVETALLTEFAEPLDFTNSSVVEVLLSVPPCHSKTYGTSVASQSRML